MVFFFRKQEANGSRPFRTPDGQRIYAIGDLHGRADLLKQMHAMILQDAALHHPMGNVVVYMGDYLDRGPYVQDTLDELLGGLPDGFTTYYLRGNHEQIFLDFLKEPAILPAWIDLGGLWTLISYGIRPGPPPHTPERCEQLRNDLIANMPDKHLSFLQFLRLHIQLGDYLFVHAGIRPDAPLDQQNPDDLLWMRDTARLGYQEQEFMLVNGHTIAQEPTLRPYRLGIDTGAYATGVLTCAVFEESRIRFLNTAGEA